jgi:Chalcone isomerase-like
MSRTQRLSGLLVLAVIMLPLLAQALVEPKSGVEYPDEMVLGEGDMSVTLKATGAGLREKTFLKVDVYTIVSYVDAAATLEGDHAQAVLNLDAPKRLRMDLRRSFSREKLVNAFKDVIEKNYDDMSPFIDDMAVFFTYFDRDAEDGDVIIFHYCPAEGLTTTLNDEEKGVIDNFEFVKAMWTVWFGEKPSNKDLRANLVAGLSE